MRLRAGLGTRSMLAVTSERKPGISQLRVPGGTVSGVGRRFPVIVGGLVGLLAGSGSALADGIDISFPQCGTTIPAGVDFTIIDVNGGRPFSPNPCLAQQIVERRDR